MVKVLEGAFRSQGEGELPTDLDELAREGARRMLIAALEAEVADYIARHRQERDERGHAQVVRNGRARARKVTMGAGTVKVRAPRVHDRREGEKFTSRILPPYMGRSPKVAEVLPILYLRGLLSSDTQSYDFGGRVVLRSEPPRIYRRPIQLSLKGSVGASWARI